MKTWGILSLPGTCLGIQLSLVSVHSADGDDTPQKTGLPQAS